jgi:hypothetical protein
MDAALDLGLDLQALEDRQDLLFQGVHLFHGPVVLVADLGFDALVLVGVEVHEGHVLQFVADLAHAQTVGDGGIDLQCFAGDLDLFFRAQVGEGADVVQAVRQFDQYDPDIGGHGDDHLLQGFGLGVLDVHFGDLGDLGHAPDEIADLLAEKFVQVFAAVLGIFDHVVQQAGGNGYFVHFHVGQDPGHGQRVDDVGLIGRPFLVQMGIGGNGIGFFQQGDIGFGIITEYFFLQFVETLDHFPVLYIIFGRWQRVLKKSS